MPAEITTLVGMIKEHIPPRNLTVEKIQLLMEYIKLAQEFFLQLQNVSADVYVDYSFNSIIAATNNVYIADKGCFNSKITAGGNIYINGIIRGGEVNAKGNILVKEAGSETGSKTILQTSSGKIKIFNKIYDGVVVYINNRLLKITGTMGPVIFSNDDGEQVQIKYL